MSFFARTDWLIPACCGLLFLTVGPFGRAFEVTPPFDPGDPPEGLFLEEWARIHLAGRPVGYAFTSFSRSDDQIRTLQRSVMRVARGPADTADMETTVESRETVAGELVAFRLVQDLGLGAVITVGEVTTVPGETGGGVLEMVVLRESLPEAEYRREIPWDGRGRMYWGLTRLSLEAGFEAGAEYRIPLYLPETAPDRPVDARVTVRTASMVDTTAGAVRAVPVDTVVNLPGGVVIPTRSWIDRKGRTVRTLTRMGGLELVTEACREEEALDDFVPADLFAATFLQLERGIPPDAVRTRFHVRWKRAMPTEFRWPDMAAQRAERDPSGGWLVTVEAGQPEALAHPGTGVPEAAALAANPYIDADDPLIREIADRIAGHHGDDDAATIEALRRYVTEAIDDKAFDVGFATASAVVRERRGDCTEHAVLLAALLRAAGYPSRVAVGLVYLPRFGDHERMLGFHLWTQVLRETGWVDLDAALGETDCRPRRIALAVSTLEGGSLAEIALSILDAVAGLEVELVESE